MAINKTPINLYKYTSAETASTILKTQKIKITNPNEFNDPFDCNIPNFEMANKSLTDEIKRQLKKDIPELKNKHSKEVALFEINIKQKIDELKILVNQEFTKISNEWEGIIENFRVLSLAKSEKNILMWSHYASYHTGACIGFKADSSISKQCQQVDYGHGSTILRNFVNHLVRIIITRIDVLSQNVHFADIFSDKAADETLNVFIEYLYLKRKEWNYEQEFRLVLPKTSGMIEYNAQMSLIEFNKNDLEEIIPGSKMKQEQVDELSAFIKQKYPGVLVKKAIKQGWELQFIEV